MTEKSRKKKRKKHQLLVLEEQTEESPALAELIRVLEEAEKDGKPFEIQICPKCKSLRVSRVKTMSGDLWSHLGWTGGWQARLVLKATNKRLIVKDVEIIAEASEASG
jgi:hypothetical protein